MRLLTANDHEPEMALLNAQRLVVVRTLQRLPFSSDYHPTGQVSFS
jgi:hypothetical protein